MIVLRNKSFFFLNENSVIEFKYLFYIASDLQMLQNVAPGFLLVIPLVVMSFFFKILIQKKTYPFAIFFSE